MDNHSSGYITKLDEIDKWLFDSFGILPGCGCSQENLRHTTARMVAEVLWPKKDLALTPEDVVVLVNLYEYGKANGWTAEDVIRRFNEQRKK